MDADEPPTRRAPPPSAGQPFAAADATTTTAAAAGRPHSTPLQVPNRPTTARRRDSSIRLRRLTSSSQTSDLFQTANDRPGNRNSHAASDFQLTVSPASPYDNEYGRHVALPSQTPGRSDGAAALPSPLTNAPVVGLRAGQSGMASGQGDKHDSRKQRMTMFGRRHSRSVTSEHAVGEGEAMEQHIEMANHDSKRRSRRASLPLHGGNDYEANIVDMLDVLDPEVSTMSSITNVQNSLFVPSLGRFVNRRPTFTLTPYPRTPDSQSTREEESNDSPVDTRSTPFEKGMDSGSLGKRETTPGTDGESMKVTRRTPLERMPSVLTDDHFAVRPSDTSLATWSDEDLADLDDYVRHMLHSRRSKVGRRFRAFVQYVRKPMGFFVTLYATLIFLVGTAWIVFLIGWVSLGNEDEQSAVVGWTNVGLVTLCCLVGICLAPWRAVDTYHLIYIVRWDRFAMKQLRAVAGSTNDQDASGDVETGSDHKINSDEDLTLSVLSSQQRASLEYHQACFAKSHTFYKPRESETHQAFPLRLLIAIVILLDSNSILQLTLALCAWIIPNHARSLALTISLLCCGMGCNIAGGILISIGDKRTRKKEAVERMWRQQLTAEAIRRTEAKRAKAERKKQKKLETEDEERKRRLQHLGRIREEEDGGGGGRTSSQWLRKSLDVVRGRDVISLANSDRSLAR